jgi:hypothetical protein
MKFALTAGALALGTALTMAPAAHALETTIFSETYQYGTGQRDPGGSDPLGDGYVTVSDQSSTRFNDSFDFSGLPYESIDRFDLTLTFYDAGPSFGLFWGFIPYSKENWSVRVPGSDSSFTGETSGDNSGSDNDFFGSLSDALSPQTFVVSMTSDTVGGDDAFAEALAIEKFIFGFSDFGVEKSAFNLESAKLDIVGVVPLPAAAWLLGGIAGLGLIAGRRKPRA